MTDSWSYSSLTCEHEVICDVMLGFKIATIEQVEFEYLNELDCSHHQTVQIVSKTGACSSLAGTSACI